MRYSFGDAEFPDFVDEIARLYFHFSR